MHPQTHHISCSFLVKHRITQVTQTPYSPDLVPCNFWLFPKLKSPLKGKRFQTFDEIQENLTGQLTAIGRTVWGPKVPTLKGTETLYKMRCFLYLLSSSINVSIFQSTWLDTFWTHLVYMCMWYIPTMWITYQKNVMSGSFYPPHHHFLCCSMFGNIKINYINH